MRAPSASELMHVWERGLTHSPVDHALAILEPPHPDSDRHDIGQSDAGTTDQAYSEQHQPEVRAVAEATDQIPHTEGQASGESKTLWTPGVQLATGEHHHEREAGQADGEHDLGPRIAPSGVLQTRGEYRPGVDRTQTELDE